MRFTISEAAYVKFINQSLISLHFIVRVHALKATDCVVCRPASMVLELSQFIYLHCESLFFNN